MGLIQRALQGAADFSALKRKKGKGKVPQKPTPVPPVVPRRPPVAPVARRPVPAGPSSFPKRPKGTGGF